MEKMITREEALALLRRYNKEPFHLQHALTVEAVMRWFANELGYGEEADFWAMCGLLLAAGGFDGLAAVQTDGALRMITFMYIVIPFLFQILQTLLISQLKVEQANRDWDNAHATEAKA